MRSDDRAGPPRRACWQVRGRVQGVGFRWFVREQARRIGVAGDVCNLSDGSVEVRAVASDERLGELLAVVRTGPPGSRVDDVDTLDAPEDIPADGFEVRFLGG